MLPDPNQIIRNRVLAIRTEVTQPLAVEMGPATRAQALPFEVVHIEPLIVGTEGPIDPDSLDPLWIACELLPGAAVSTCLRDQFPLDLDDIPECPPPDFEDLAGEELPEYPSPCVLARTGAPDFVVPFSTTFLIGGDIELTMIAGEPGEISTDDCIEPFLDGDYELPDECLYASHRLWTGPFDYFLLTVNDLGIPIPGLEPPYPEDVETPNHNPRITRFAATTLDEDGEPGELVDIEGGDVVELELDQTLRVEIEQPEDELETFLVPINDGEDFEEESETYFGDWYRTWGRILSPLSDDPETFNEWTFLEDLQDETSEPPDGRAFLYYVVRDGRGGVDWTWLEARVP